MTTSVQQQMVHAQAKRAVSRGGFTLIELVVVITIIATLAAIGFPIYQNAKKNSHISATKTMIQAVASAMEAYQAKTWMWERTPATANKPAEYVTKPIWNLNQHNSAGAEIPDIKIGEPNGAVGALKFFSIDGYTPGSRASHVVGSKNQEDWFVDASDTTSNITVSPGPPGITDEKERLWDGNFPPAVIKSGYTGFLNMVAPNIHPKFIRKDGRLMDAWGQLLRIRYQARIFGASTSFGIWSPGYNKADETFRNDSLSSPAWSDIPENTDDLRSWK
jgi:prepilin-type N-terminal cleavage/methylation domain-containing protein